MAIQINLATAGAVVVAAFALAGASVAADRPSDQYNEYGAAVRDSGAHARNYSRDELTAQKMGASGSTVTELSPSVGTAALGFKPVWTYVAFGQGIGKSNILIADNGPQKEIYLGGSTSSFGDDNYWYALRYRAQRASYEPVFASQLFDSGIRRIVVGDVLGEDGLEILVGLANGNILIYDQQTKARLTALNTLANDLRGLYAADVDADGKQEILASTPGGLYVYGGDGALEWSLAGAGGEDVVAAQMDDDGALEIALTGGFVVDAATRTAQWTRAAGFGRRLAAADIDGDGRHELIAAEAWYFVWAYDVETMLPKWSIPTQLDIGAIAVSDVDGDSVFELLVGDGQWGRVTAYSTATQLQQWFISNPEHGVTAIATGDVDGDGQIEVLWGAGATSTGPDRLYVGNGQASRIEWENIQLEGPFRGPESGDLDGDGLPEVVVVSHSSDAGYDSGRILVFDGRTLALRGVSEPVAGGLGWTGVHDLRLRDVDADGRSEILIATDRLYDGVIEIYDFAPGGTVLLQWTNTTRPSGAPFHSVDAADVDGDGSMEIVAGGGREHTGAAGVFLYVYDYTSGGEEWRSLQMGDYWGNIPGLEIGDLDGDGTMEIAGLTNTGETYILDGQSKALETILSASYTDLQILTGGAIPLLMLSDTSGDISIQGYSNGVYSELFRRNFVSGSIDGFAFRGQQGLWLGSGGTLKLMGGSGPIWASDPRGTGYGTGVVKLSSAPVIVTSGIFSIDAYVPTRVAAGTEK